MGNQLNSGSLDTLTTGQTLLVSARKVNGDKISLEFAENLNSGDMPKSILAEINFDDPRFSSKARRAWMAGSVAGINKVLDIDVSATADWYMSDKGEMLDLNILNPVKAIDNTRLRMLITETTEPTEFQQANVETTAKRRGKDGDFITHQGANVWSNTTMVATNENELPHIYLESDANVELTNIKEEELASMV